MSTVDLTSPGNPTGLSRWPAVAVAASELRFNRSQHIASVIVAFLGSVLGTILIESEAMLQRQSSGGGFYVHPYVPLLLGVLGFIFVAVATFVAVIVTANTFGIVMAGRAQRTALLRLLGATAKTLRRSVAIEGAVVGVIGSFLGVLAGVAIAAIVSGALIATGVFLPLSMSFMPWPIVFPLVIGILSTTVAAWIGTHSIVSVSAVAALGSIQEPGLEQVRANARARRHLTTGSVIVGLLMLIGGVAIGAASPFGLFLAVPGGALSFLGFVSGASSFLPVVLSAVGRLVGRSPAGRLAAANAMRYPARSSRSTIGLVIGITLVTMFGVAGQTYTDVAAQANAALPPAARDSVSPFLSLVLGVIALLVGFSLLIAAVGLVNSLSLSVIQRRREIGLLRALGLSKRQVRAMIFVESLQLTVTGTVCGIVLGTIYGWAGALTALTSDHHIGHYFWFSFPAWLFVGIVVSAIVLCVVASLIPARRATGIAPVHAAAMD